MNRSLLMITNDITSSAVSAYQAKFGLSTVGSATRGSSSAGVEAGGDTVQLSTTAQVAAMHTAGMSVKQIAASQGLTTEEVDTYLGINTSSAPSGRSSAPVQSGVSGGSRKRT